MNAARQSKKGRRSQSKAEEIVTYAIEIEDWDWSYSFGLNSPKDDDPCFDFRHLDILGRVLRPTKLKAQKARITLLPTPEYDHGQRKDLKLLAVGSLRLKPYELTGLLSIPADALAPILTVLGAGRLRYVVMRGAPLKHRQARLRSFSLDKTINEDDLPPEE